MCIAANLYSPLDHAAFMKQYILIIWIISLIVLTYWCLEILIIRNIIQCAPKRLKQSMNCCCRSECKCCCQLKIAAAFLMTLLSTLALFLSSTLFLYSSLHPSATWCQHGPIAAILFRFLSKHCLWGFNIVRGQMVIEMLENKWLNLFVKHSPKILSAQMVLIAFIILMSSDAYYDSALDACKTDIPLILILLLVFIGEVLYGFGFLCIFFNAMRNSMQRVLHSLTRKEQSKTKRQLIHHLIVYILQFILSTFYIVSIISCSSSNSFASFDLFQIELLLSNMLLLTLFRGRIKWCKKHCVKPIFNKDEANMIRYLDTTTASNCHRTHRRSPRPLPVLLDTTHSNRINEGKQHTLIIRHPPSTLDDIKQTEEEDEGELESKDILANMPAIQICNERANPTYHDVISPRRNSISVNPLLPNSWLSPRSIECFKKTIQFDQQRTSLSATDLASPARAMQTRSEPVIKSLNTWAASPTTATVTASKSSSVLERRSIRSLTPKSKSKTNPHARNLNASPSSRAHTAGSDSSKFDLECIQMDKIRLEHSSVADLIQSPSNRSHDTNHSMMRSKSARVNPSNSNLNDDHDANVRHDHVSDRFTIGKASRSLLKRATRLFTTANVYSDSTPFANRNSSNKKKSEFDDLSTVEPIDAIVCRQDVFKYISSNTSPIIGLQSPISETTPSNLNAKCLDIVYDDDVD